MYRNFDDHAQNKYITKINYRSLGEFDQHLKVKYSVTDDYQRQKIFHGWFAIENRQLTLYLFHSGV